MYDLEEINLIQNAKRDDFAGLVEWIGPHLEEVERFSFQYGLTLDKAYDVTLDTYITFRKELESFDEGTPLIPELYRIALKKLSQYHSPMTVLDDIFPFREDAELHSKIIGLNEKYRIPFILTLFHELDNEQIAWITDSSTIEVKKNIQSAKKLIDEGNLDKHLELLGKSYNRLPIQFKVAQILGTVSQQKRSKPFKKKPVLWTIVGVLVLTVSIVAMQIVWASKGEQSANGAFFIELEENYKMERDLRQKMLSIEDGRFNGLPFIKAADERMDELANSQAIESQSQRDDMTAEVEEIINGLKLPAEMIGDVVSEPLNEDEKASVAYLSLYREKVNDMIIVYNGIVWDHRESIETILQDSQSVDLMMLTSSDFPQELQNIVDTMQDQSIKLCENKNTGEITACYYNSDSHQRMEYLLNYNTAGYVNMMTYEYYMNNKNLAYGPGWIAEELQRIEHTVVNAKKETDLYPLLESYYTNLFYEVVKGSQIVQAFEDEGLVPENYQQAWKMLVGYDEANLLSYLAGPIIKEMEASDWKSSESWEQFNREKIAETLKLARGGELAVLMFGKEPKVKSKIIELPDDQYAKKIMELYSEFIKSYDKNVFKGLSPVFVVGVFDYANEMEDPETMFNLFYENMLIHSENGSIATLESYVDNWYKGFSLFKDASSIQFTGEDLMRSGDNYQADVKITYNSNAIESVSTLLVEKELWQMGEMWLDPLPLSENSSTTSFAGPFKKETSIIYDYIREMEEPIQFRGHQAIDVVRLFYYAAERGDYGTQYALYYQGEGSQLIEKEQYVKEAAKKPKRKMEDLFKTISFKGNEQDENGDWMGVATLTVNLEENPGEEPKKDIQMIWTENGWRVMFDVTE